MRLNKKKKPLAMYASVQAGIFTERINGWCVSMHMERKFFKFVSSLKFLVRGPGLGLLTIQVMNLPLRYVNHSTHIYGQCLYINMQA